MGRYRLPIRLGGISGGGGDVAPTVGDSTFNINDGYTNGQAVGTVTFSGTPSPSLSITAGNTGSAFAINSSTGAITVNDASQLNHSVTPSYSLTVTGTNVAGSDTGAITIPVAAAGADTSITTITVTNAAASAKTNEIVTFGLPTGPTAVGAGQGIRFYDDNGSGAKGSALGYQIDYLSMDPNSKQRMARPTVILPNLGLSATRKLFSESSSTPAPTGIAITAADILATSYEAQRILDSAGTLYTFSVRDGLAASNTFSKTDYQCELVADGPYTTEYLVSGPPKNGGSAMASGDGPRVFASVRAFKPGSGAIGGGNAILLVQTDMWTENGAVDRVSPAHFYYGQEDKRATSLTDGTLISTDDTDPDGNVIRYNWPRSTPSAGITLSSAATGTGRTITRDSGTWPADIVGAHIKTSDGVANVTARTSDTVVTAYIYDAFGSTSYASGNWTIEGIGHHYNVPVPRIRSWVGQKPTNVVAWGDNASAVTATSRAPLDYLSSTKMYINAAMTYASVTHDTTAIDAMRNSDGSRRPLTFFGPHINDNDMGELTTFIGQSGWHNAIGPMPVWAMQAFAKFTAAGRRRIFENAEYFSTWQFPLARRFEGIPTNGELGVWPRADGGTDYSYNGAHSGTTTIAAASTVWWPWDSDNAHHPAAFYPAYLLTGDLYWLIMLQRQEAYTTWAKGNPGYNGAGANRTAYGDATGVLTTHMGEFQTRAKTWSTRDILYATICTPDSISAKIVNPKSYLTARVAKHWDAAVAYGPNDVLGQHSGADESPQWLRETTEIGGLTALGNPATALESPWMISFNRIVAGIAGELGLKDADGLAFQTWLAKSARDMTANDNAIARNYMSGAYWVYLTSAATGFSTRPTSWEDVYKKSCQLGPVTNGGYGFARTPTGTVTLSDNTVGAGRTIVFANNYFSNGGSWYADGYVYNTGGVFKITGVSGDGLTLTGDVVTAFGASGAQTAANIRIPGPHRLDDTGADPLVTSDSKDYAQFLVCGARLTKDQGILQTEMGNLITYCTGRAAYVEQRDAFNIAERA